MPAGITPAGEPAALPAPSAPVPAATPPGTAGAIWLGIGIVAFLILRDFRATTRRR